MITYIVTKSEMHSDSIVGVFASKAEAEKVAADKDKNDEKASYHVEVHDVIVPSDRIERMKIEEAELKYRVIALNAFMESDKFAALDETEKRLLRMQYAGMDTYLTALGSRLVHEDMKRYQREIQALSKQIPDLKAQGKTDEEIAAIMAEKAADIPTVNWDFSNLVPFMVKGSVCKA